VCIQVKTHNLSGTRWPGIVTVRYVERRSLLHATSSDHLLFAGNYGFAKRNLIGTARFASINGYLDICECPSLMCSAQILNTILVQDRCCDLESLGYMLLYFLRGSLPWQGLTAKDQAQKDALVLQKKKTVNTKDLCRDVPKEFETYFDHILSLAFNETPAYAYLRKTFRDLFVRDGFDYDYVFDWTILEYLRLCRVGLT